MTQTPRQIGYEIAKQAVDASRARGDGPEAAGRAAYSAIEAALAGRNPDHLLVVPVLESGALEAGVTREVLLGMFEALGDLGIPREFWPGTG